MKKKYNKLTCLFGFHDYSDKTVFKDGYTVHLCGICRRSGYYKWGNRVEVWVDYDKKGNIIHRKWSDGLEIWSANNGKDWVSKKPKNWKYEKDLQ